MEALKKAKEELIIMNHSASPINVAPEGVFGRDNSNSDIVHLTASNMKATSP